MRKFLQFLFLTTLSIYATGQDNIRNFLIDDDYIIWQKVYETELTKEELISEIQKSGIFDNLTIEENTISGDIKPIEADYRGAGYSESRAPIYVARSFITGFSTIEYREGKYRVTLKNIVFTQKYDDPLSRQGERTTIETYAKSRRNEFKSLFKKSASEILDYTFNKKFEFVKKENDDW